MRRTSGDIIDLRDLGKELEDLREERDDDPDNFLDDDAERLADLERLADQLNTSNLEAYGNNQEPTMIAESYFETYAQELAEDIGAIKRDMDWPCNFIDWKAASEALAQDYREVEFDGQTYYIRSC